MGKTKTDVSLEDIKYLPKHVAVIMDGNGRWAAKRGLPRSLGHREGIIAMRSIIRRSSDLGVGVLTLYAFSTENWKRPKKEISVLMDLLVEFFKKDIKELDDNNVKINIIGEYTAFPDKVSNALSEAMEITRGNSGMTLNLALNYGGRAEVLRMVKNIARDVSEGNLSIDEITEERIAGDLYTANQPDPDLLIRTGGDYRISNYLLWQMAYAELYFTEVFWPDFSVELYDKALREYASRNRRFGAV